MTFANWVGVALGLGMSAIGLARLPSFWRGTSGTHIEERLRRAWPYGDASLGRFVSAIPVLFLGFVAVMLGAAVAGPTLDAPQGSALYDIGWIGFGLIVLAFTLEALGLSIVLTGRPRRLIPPWLRSDPDKR